VRIGVISLNVDGFCYEINGGVVVSYLMGNHTKQMQGDRLIGVDLQYLLIDAFSLRQTTRSVMLHGEV